jgi:hypothetical protein
MKLKHSIVEIPDAATNAGGNSKMSVKYNVVKDIYQQGGNKREFKKIVQKLAVTQQFVT